MSDKTGEHAVWNSNFFYLKKRIISVFVEQSLILKVSKLKNPRWMVYGGQNSGIKKKIHYT